MNLTLLQLQMAEIPHEDCIIDSIVDTLVDTLEPMDKGNPLCSQSSASWPEERNIADPFPMLPNASLKVGMAIQWSRKLLFDSAYQEVI